MAKLIPFNEEDVFPSFDNWIENFFDPRTTFRLSPQNVSFKVDVKENDKAYTIEAELPGVKKEDVSVDVNNQTLCISVKHESKSDESARGYIHRERYSSSMSRSINLPNARYEGVDASLNNGILTLVVPKRIAETGNSHKITIK